MKTLISIPCPWLPALVSMLVFGDWYVDKNSPACPTGTGTQVAPFCAIGTAITAAANGDTIHVAPGIYFEHLTINKDLTLQGTGGQTTTIVDGSATGRVVKIVSGTVVIDGLTIRNGRCVPYQWHGAGIWNAGSLSLLNSTVSGNNSAFDGGGGILNSGSAALTNCTISNNSSPNQFETGAGIDNWGNMVLVGCAVNENSGGWAGGGISNRGSMTLNNCTISGNSSAKGGGIWSYGTTTVANCTISDNSGYCGGGIFGYFTTLTNCTLSGNYALGYGTGGGVYANGPTALSSCTVSGNSAPYEGGGIFNATGNSVTMRNTLVAGNTSAYSPQRRDLSGSFVSLGHNLVGAGGSGFINGVNGDKVGLNPLLAALANNGGLTQTRALLPYSPAIDAGDPVIFEPTDQRGVVRPAGFSDIGAYELSPNSPPWIMTFCTAGTTTHGCMAAINGTGAPIAGATSGFLISVANVEINQSGIIFYGLSGSTVDPWGSGPSFRCVKYPLERTGRLNSGTGGGACGGVLSIDWNQYMATHPSALGSPLTGGETVWAQAWFRDPPAPKTTNLSNGLQFTVFP